MPVITPTPASPPLPIHPVCAALPDMAPAEYATLREDIRAHGLREAIWTHDGAIIDGRHRYRACLETGVVPTFRAWDGEGSLVAFVVSLNLHRRHLDASQRAMVAARLATLGDGQRQVGKFAEVATQAEAAALLSVGERSVRDARVVLDRGAPGLQEAVAGGRVAVSTAAALASLPASEQAEVVAGGDGAIQRRAQEVRAARSRRRHRDRSDAVLTAPARSIFYRRFPYGFPVLLADPPWPSDQRADPVRGVQEGYPSMSVEEIRALRVADLAANDAVLFLWATGPHLEAAFTVLKAWGFAYRACAVLDRTRVEVGSYFREQHELLLMGSRGDMPAPPTRARPRSVIRARRGRHGERPEAVYALIERMYPGQRRVQLFPRQGRRGWFNWGTPAAPTEGSTAS